MTGPYIVTAKRLDFTLHNGGPLSRRAVATLDEAQEHATTLASEWIDPQSHEDEWHDAIWTLPESGGTVGPLPDGTVIEVEATTWRDLAADLPIAPRVVFHAEAGNREAQRRILDAYNARQELAS